MQILKHVKGISVSFQETVEHLVRLALAEDLGERGDVTSKATFPSDLRICGRIIAKANGVIAGLPIVKTVYQQIDPEVEVHFHIQDGDTVSPGTLVCEVNGKGYSVLSGERTALNFLQRLSGIATVTSQFVQAVSGTQASILDTRKTTPGWRELEKYAVRMGGGQNHRMGLYDVVMIKDNHIDAAGSITKAVNATRAYHGASDLKIIVEVRDETELREALALRVDRILLDNMTEDQMRNAVQIVSGQTPLEASGNMRLDRIASVAQTGVDFISVGSLTHSAPALDLSMKLSGETK